MSFISSWNRFKGLEADAIVIIETPGRDDARERVNRYVARSRAKHLLTVVETGEPQATAQAPSESLKKDSEEPSSKVGNSNILVVDGEYHSATRMQLSGQYPINKT